MDRYKIVPAEDNGFIIMDELTGTAQDYCFTLDEAQAEAARMNEKDR